MPPHPRPPATPAVTQAQASFHEAALSQVVEAVAAHDVVVVGMSINPHVGDTRRDLQAAGVPFHYLGFGGYLSQWKTRLAIKLWSGWPTFPQIFVKGTLVGGHSDLVAAMADGTFQRLLEGERPAAPERDGAAAR